MKILLTTETNFDMQVHLRFQSLSPLGENLKFQRASFSNIWQEELPFMLIAPYMVQSTGKGSHVSRLQTVLEFNNFKTL